MNTHDNDMDQLFRSKLDGFEVEPSANVWTGISAELGNAPKRKSIAPMLRIAAGVAVVISAGLFFLPKKQVEVQPTKGGKVAMNSPSKPLNGRPMPSQVPTQIVPVNVAVPVQQVASIQPWRTSSAVNRTAAQTPATVAGQPTVADPGKTNVAAVTDQSPLIAAVATNTNKAVVPDATISIVDRQTDSAPGFTTKPASTAVMAAVASEDDTRPSVPAKKHKLSLGGILNAVVGAVDKRKDKLIEFGDNDEGETVTGINLGIIKVKKVE